MKKNEMMKLAQWFADSNLNRLVWKDENCSLELEKGGSSPFYETLPRQEVPQRVEREVKQEVQSFDKEEGYILRSPVVGTFYSSPSPDEKPFVTVGQKVSKGQVVCIVEAMKLLNEVSSPVDGVVKKIFIQNEEMVEYDEKLIEIEVE